MPRSEMRSTNNAESRRAGEPPGWHFTIFTRFEWDFGREPLLLSVDF